MTTSPGYDAARRRAAFLERVSRGRIAVAGNDRRSYLHAMLTNDIAALAPGTGCYAAYLTPQGRMISDMTVLELGDLVLLDLPAAVAAVVLQKLDEFVFSEDVKLGDLSATFAGLRIVGPDAARVVVETLGDDARHAGVPSADELQQWAEYRNARAAFRGEMVLLAATRDLGVPGFDLLIEAPHLAALRQAVEQRGAVAMDDEAAEVLRLEAGRPLFGVDMDAETIPLEAGIEPRAISFSKGCYPGQEVIVRVVHRGHGRVAKRLVGFEFAAEEPTASPGDTVHVGDREAGRITSAAWSPLLARPIGLGYIHRDFTEPGTEALVYHGGQRLAAKVAALPLTRD